MTKTILQRINLLADAPPSPLVADAASVLRRLASESDPVAKAHGIAGVLRNWEPGGQDIILKAAESLVVT